MRMRPRWLRLVLQVMCVVPILQFTAAAQEPQITPHDSVGTQEGAAVVVAGKTLFYVQERVHALLPADRARLISDRVGKLFKSHEIPLDSLQVVEGENVSDIMAGDLVIMTVTDRDARAAGVPRAQLAQRHVDAIRGAAAEIRREFGLQAILIGLAWAALATIALLVALRALGYVFPKLYGRLESWRGTRIPSIRIQRLELLTSSRLTDGLLMLARWLRIAAVIFLIYVYLPLVLSFFPWTAGYANAILSGVFKPLRLVGSAFVDYLPNVLFIAIILVVSHYAVRLVRFFFAEVGKGTIHLPGFYPDWVEPTFKLVRFLIVAFTVIVVFPYLPGSNSPAFRGVSLFFGVLFSLGSTSAVANIVAGLVLTYTRAFQIGDRVTIGDTTGDVIEKTLLVTRVRSIKNVDIAVPNSIVLNSHIVNFSSSAAAPGLILHTAVTIGYDAPWRQVHNLLVSAAESTANILKEPRPFVLQTSLDDFYVSYQLNAYTAEPGVMAETYSELHQNIQDKFAEAGVEIMSPHYGALRDGNRVTIPATHLPAEYVAPSFRVETLGRPSAGAKGPSGRA